MPNGFQDEWIEFVGSIAPIGYELRTNRPSDLNWTRLHALPKSKRYAESSSENEQILMRANSIGEEFFQRSKSIWIATMLFPNIHEHVVALQIELIRSFNMTISYSFRDAENFEDEEVKCFAAKVEWQYGFFDDLFSAIAQDEFRAIFFSPKEERIVAPYDGGFDLFAKDTELINKVEGKYADWMSARSDKL